MDVAQFRDDEVGCFERYICGTIDSLVAALGGLNERELSWRPDAPDTNSLYGIAMHVLANAEENILGTVCGLAVTRNRAEEFSAGAASAATVQERWQALRARIHEALARLAASDLGTPRPHPRRGTLAAREVLLIAARHAAEHWGEAQLTRSLLRTRARA